MPTSERFMRIHSPEFAAMSRRVLEVTALTTRLNLTPFEDDDTKLALFAQILGHPVDPGERRGWLPGGPIDVAENVWIGAGATILPGVSIGRDAVVAAGAVVAEDVPAASLVTGRAAEVKRQW